MTTTKKQKLPKALKVVCGYANSKVTEQNWRRVVLGVFADDFLPRGVVTPEAPVFGVSSREELELILNEYRSFLRRVVGLGSPKSIKSVELCDELHRRAKLEVERLGFSKHTGLVTPVWRTAGDGFREMLYAHLVFALQEVPSRHLRECGDCRKFFLDESNRRTSFCSSRCRTRASIRQYRKRYPDKYREYQRDLMKKRYETRKKQASNAS